MTEPHSTYVADETFMRLALRWGSQRYIGGAVFSSDAELADVDVKQGGAQIEYPDSLRGAP